MGEKVRVQKEIRKFLESRVGELYRPKVIEEVRRVIEKLPEMPRGSVTCCVREDRDSMWLVFSVKYLLKKKVGRWLNSI